MPIIRAKEITARDHALALIRERGYSVKEVYRVDSPGDGVASASEVLYVDLEGKPMRAYIRHQDGKNALLWTRHGWELPTGYDLEPDE